MLVGSFGGVVLAAVEKTVWSRVDYTHYERCCAVDNIVADFPWVRTGLFEYILEH